MVGKELGRLHRLASRDWMPPGVQQNDDYRRLLHLPFPGRYSFTKFIKLGGFQLIHFFFTNAEVPSN
jgi:hypothetical protein